MAAEQATPVKADNVVDRKDAAWDVSDEVSNDDMVPDEAIDRFGAALEETTGGFMAVSREVPRNRKQFAKVPPLVGEPFPEIEPAPAATP